jgi:hypothetical protein
MPKRIPISSAKRFAQENDCKQVIIAAWDGELTHIVTYGATTEDCAQAALGGNRIKEALGWPKDLRTEPSRVRQLQARIKELEVLLLHTIENPANRVIVTRPLGKWLEERKAINSTPAE